MYTKTHDHTGLPFSELDEHELIINLTELQFNPAEQEQAAVTAKYESPRSIDRFGLLIAPTGDVLLIVSYRTRRALEKFRDQVMAVVATIIMNRELKGILA
jgi:hypothetical protein